METKTTGINAASTILFLISICFLPKFIYSEILQFKLMGGQYFKQLYNYIDITTYILPILSCILEIIQTHSSAFTDDNFALRLISSLAIIVSWLKMLTYLRGH